MRALMLVADRKIELLDIPAPPAPAAGEVQIRIKAIGLNHIDVWGWRGMAFAKRTLPSNSTGWNWRRTPRPDPP